MSRPSSVPRSGVRLRIQGRAVFHQEDCVGHWDLVDVSEGGFQATGDLDALDLSRPIWVNVQHSARNFRASVVNVWRRRTPDGESLHGWEIEEIDEENSDPVGEPVRDAFPPPFEEDSDEVALEDARPTDPGVPVPGRRGTPDAVPAESGIPVWAWIVLLSLTTALLGAVVAVLL